MFSLTSVRSVAGASSSGRLTEITSHVHIRSSPAPVPVPAPPPAPAPARSKIAGPWHVDPKDGDLVRDIVGQSPDFVAAVMRGETADFEARAWNWNTAIHVDEYRTEEDAKNGADQALRAYGWTLQDAVTEIEPPPPTRPSERTATRTT